MPDTNVAVKPLLDVRDLAKDFDVSRPWLNRVLEGQPRQLLKAVDGVTFTINRGETLSLVGESGCGKSTVARMICGLYPPSRGSVNFDGVDLATITDRNRMLAMRRRLQMIFQDPYASLNPRCPHAFDRCRVDRPDLMPTPGVTRAACWLHAKDVVRA